MNTVITRQELTLQDRCDACGAAAKVSASFIQGELMFCGHHAHKLAPSLVLKAVSVFDPEGLISING
jgi:hypothetical protein